MSKKLAENLDRLVLDVKFGSGAFMKTEAEAKKLAAAMTKVGKRMGVKIKHLLTPMDEPLGRTVGNALEVAECVEVLQGGGPTDLIDLTLDLAELVSTVSRKQLASWLHDGTAWRKFVALVYAQDGDASALERITEIHRAPIIYPLPAPTAGIVKKWMPKRSAALPFSRRRPAKIRRHDRFRGRFFRHQKNRRTRRSARTAHARARTHRSSAGIRAPSFGKSDRGRLTLAAMAVGLALPRSRLRIFNSRMLRGVTFFVRSRASSNHLRKRTGYSVAGPKVAHRYADTVAPAGRSRAARDSVQRSDPRCNGEKSHRDRQRDETDQRVIKQISARAR